MPCLDDLHPFCRSAHCEVSRALSSDPSFCDVSDSLVFNLSRTALELITLTPLAEQRHELVDLLEDMMDGDDCAVRLPLLIESLLSIADCYMIAAETCRDAYHEGRGEYETEMPSRLASCLPEN